MDPKMDSGCLASGESLDEDYNVMKPLAAEQVLGIIDQLLCHEVSIFPVVHAWSASLMNKNRWLGTLDILYHRHSLQTSISKPS